MAPTKFINLLAVVSFTVFYISLAPITANALAVERAHVARNLNYPHAGIARKKRDASAKRCKPRPSSSSHTHSSSYSPEPPSPTPTHTTSSHLPSSTPKPQPPPVASSSSSSHAPAVTPDVSSNAGVVGLAWSNGEQSSLCNFKSSQTGLVYNWQLKKYTDVDVSKCGFEFIPQVWGEKDVSQVAGTLVRGYATRVFAFNEPDQSGQSNLGVDQGVQLFMQYINPLQYLGYEIIGPACTNAPAGVQWTKSFVAKVRQQGGKIDAVATHYYGTSSSDFIQFMQGFLALFPGDGVYLTEFAAQDYSGANNQLDYNQIQSFLETTTGWMRSQAQIKAYFWFGAMTADELAANQVNGLNSLMGNNDSPNQLGKIYIGA